MARISRSESLKSCGKGHHATCRLWIFQPCRASRSDTLLRRITDNAASRSRVAGKQPDYQIHERWFPDCHYDLGRQQFEFLREGSGNGVNIFERASSFLSSPMSRSVIPNKSSADAVLRWLLEKVDQESGNPIFDCSRSLIGFDDDVHKTRNNPRILSAQSLSECSGDIYDQLELYAPGARLLPSGLRSWASLLFPGLNELSKIALATRDRRVSCMSSSASDGVTLTTVEDYKSSLLANDLSAFRRKYPSKTFELHEKYCPNH